MKTAFFTIFIAILSLSSPSLSQRCNRKDEKALFKIKKSLGNPYHLASWNRNYDCCRWRYVQCDLYNDRITSLAIFSANISARIPDALGGLPFLETLYFHKITNLTGPLPFTLTKLTRLKSLTFTWTNLNGSIPCYISQLKSLTYLDLSFNNFTGTIPPELPMLPNLQTLHLDRNRLTGPIPESFGMFAGKPPAIYLSHNLLSGTIPKSLARVNFTWLDLSRNRLQGDLSVFFGTNKTIKTADFSRNLFEFNFSRIIRFPASLSALDLNHNRIYGSLPATLARLNLQKWNVSYNRLCGEIPAGGNLQKYNKTAYFHNRCLCGSPLPACH